MLPADRQLRLRTAVAVALVVALPLAFIYAFVLAMNTVGIALLEWRGGGPYHGEFYVDPVVAAVVVAGGLAAQAWFGPRAVLGSVGADRVDADSHPELHAAVTRLAHQVDLDPPAVALARNAAPNAMALDGPSGSTVVVTTGLLERLDDREREAVLAHELAHLKNRDATVMTVAWLLPTITYYVALAAFYVLYGIFRMMGAGGGSSRRGDGAAKVILVLVVAAAFTLAISALFWAASVLVHRVLSRYREYAADRGAASLTGDPAALASALRTMDEAMPSVPDRDLRRLDGGSEALCAVPLESRAFGDAGLVSTDVFPATHPPTDERIERLRRMAGELS